MAEITINTIANIIAVLALIGTIWKMSINLGKYVEDVEKRINEKYNNVVFQDTCNSRYHSLEKSIDDLRGYMSERFNEILNRLNK